MNALVWIDSFWRRMLFLLAWTAVIPLFAEPILAEHLGDSETATVAPGLAGAGSLERLFPEELACWPDPIHEVAWNSSSEWFASVRGGTHDHEDGPRRWWF